MNTYFWRYFEHETILKNNFDIKSNISQQLDLKDLIVLIKKDNQNKSKRVVTKYKLYIAFNIR